MGHGKDESCQIEGTENHWQWLAMLILGLAREKDSPYTEDKPLPFDPRETLLRLARELGRARRIIGAWEEHAAGDHNDPDCRVCNAIEAALAAHERGAAR